MPSDQDIKKILETYKRIAVIGISPEPARPSYGVSRYLISQGFDVVGVRPGADEVLGRPCYPSLSAVPAPLEIVDVFRKPDAVPGIVDEIEAFMQSHPGQGPKVLWLQEGVVHKEAEEKARALGLQVISDRCLLKEHRRLIGPMGGPE